MLTNLAYAGGGSNTYGDATSPITQGSSFGDYTYTAARYFVHSDANRTTGTTDPSTSTDGGTTNPQYGYLYNWCAAMGGQAAACQSTAATQPNQSANPGNGTIYNVCPAGWRLPTGGSGGEFASLSSSLGWTSGAPTPLFSSGLFMYSGNWANGTFNTQGGNGSYWSSTIVNATNIYNLQFTTSTVYQANSNNRRNGYAVRCIAT